jgi:ABC-type dipeptide/oligopeptide/nickel transport system permease component
MTAAYILRRFVSSIVVLFTVVTLVFFAVRVLSGDPVTAMLGDHATAQAVQSMRTRLGLDNPMYVQYFGYLFGLLHGDAGRSISGDIPVIQSFIEVFPFTLALALGSIVFGLLLSIPLGVLAAIKRSSLLGSSITLLSFVGVSIPSFVMAVTLLLLFGSLVPILPVMGGGDLSNIPDFLRHLILPVLSKGLITAAVLARLVRAKFLVVLGEDYMKTAAAKGLSRSRILLKHGLKAVLAEISTMAGIELAAMLGGLVLTEVVFTRPGLGKLLYTAVIERDYFTLQGGILVFCILVIGVNFLADVVCVMVDPRLQYD